VSELSSAVCSITATKRRRYFWAAWWTGAPCYSPFRKPDAAHGGARSVEEALAEAERASGRHLVRIEPYWAHAFNRILRGESPPPLPDPSKRVERVRPEPARSSWTVLGLTKDAELADLKRAYRQRALETHPDQGGDPDAFLELQRAYEKLSRKLRK
jgi:hypothetical protein